MKYLLPTSKNQEFLDLYNDLIDSASENINNQPNMELHHILPRSMGGSNSKLNLVYLSTEQHYEAHYLLWKAYENQQMSCAFHLMTTNKSDRRQLSVDEFVKLREDYRLSKKEYWKSLSEDKREHHRKACNPWVNKTPEEREVYKKKCNSWVGQPEDEIIRRKKELAALYKGVGIGAGILGNKEDRIHSYKASVAKRTDEDRAKLNYGNNRGTKWINDGVTNKRVNLTDTVPEGWIKGRVKQGTI
jgi:hypothetical protein